MRTEKFVDFVKNVRLVHGFNIHIRMCLDDAYYFKPRKDAPFQPICWKVYFSAVHSLKNFKIDIARTREGTTIHWHKELFFSFISFRCLELLIKDI